jgi:hypothetical protein
MVGRRARPLLRTAYPGRVGDSTAPAGGRWRRRAWPRPAPRDPPAPADPGNPQDPGKPQDPRNPEESGNPPERGPDDRPGRMPRRRRPPSRTPIRRRTSFPPAAVARDGPARSARPHRRGRAPAIRRIRFHVKPKRSASVPAWKGSSLDRRTYRSPAPCHPCPLRMGRHRQRSRPRYRTTRAGRQQSACPDRPPAASWPTLSTRGQPTADGRARLRMCVTCAPSIPGAGWTNRRETHREHREPTHIARASRSHSPRLAWPHDPDIGPRAPAARRPTARLACLHDPDIGPRAPAARRPRSSTRGGWTEDRPHRTFSAGVTSHAGRDRPK